MNFSLRFSSVIPPLSVRPGEQRNGLEENVTVQRVPSCQYVPLVPHCHLTDHLKNRDFLASNFSHKYSQHFLSIKTGDLNIPPVFCSVWSWNWSWSYTVKVGAINKTAQIISPQNFLFHPNLPNLQLRRSLLKPQLTNLFLYTNDDKKPD